MSDAERLAKAIHAEEKWRITPWDNLDVSAQGARITCAQRLIDSGLVTIHPPPDPAEQIAEAWRGASFTGSAPTIMRRLIDAGWIVPGPRCDQ